MDSTRAVSTAEYAGRAGAQALPKAVNPSCFGNIEDVCQQASAVAQRVEKLINRLCGYPPPTPTDPSVQSEPDGLLEAADRQARDIRANLQRVLDATERLEKQLP